MINTTVFKMSALKAWLFDNYNLKVNIFSGSWEFVPDGEIYGQPLSIEDKIEMYNEAAKVFPGLTLGGIKCITDTVWNYNFLADRGRYKGLTYTLRYRTGNIALYFCAGDRFSTPKHIIRRALRKDFFETVINWCSDDQVVAEFNRYLSINRLQPISLYDLKAAPFTFREKQYSQNFKTI